MLKRKKILSAEVEKSSEPMNDFIQQLEETETVMYKRDITVKGRGWHMVITDNEKMAIISSGTLSLTFFTIPTQISKVVSTYHALEITSLRKTVDNEHAASLSYDGVLSIWDINKQKLIKYFKFDENGDQTIEFDQYKNLFIGLNSGKILKLEMENNFQFIEYSGHTSKVNYFCIDMKKNILYSASSDKSIIMWDTQTNTRVYSCMEKGHNLEVYVLKLTPNNKYLITASADKTVKIWDTNEKKLVFNLVKHAGEIYCLAVSSSKNLVASGSQDKSVNIWDISNGTLFDSFDEHIGYVTCVTFTRDDNYVLSSSFAQITMFNVLKKRTEIIFTGHTEFVICLYVTKDNNTLISSSRDCTVKFWDINTNKEFTVLKGHKLQIICMEISPNGKILISGSTEGVLKVWDLNTMEERCTLYGHIGFIRIIKFFKDSRHFLSCSSDPFVKLWDIVEGVELYTFYGHTYTVTRLAVTNSLKYFASGSGDDSLKFWSVPEKVQLFSIPHEDLVSNIYITSDDLTIFTSTSDKYVRKIDIGSRSVEEEYMHNEQILLFIMSRCETIFCTFLANNTISIWNIKKKKQKNFNAYHITNPDFLFLTENNDIVITASKDGLVKYWNTKELYLISVFNCKSPVCSATFDYGKSFLFTGLLNGAIKIWNIYEKREEASISTFFGEITYLILSKDRKYLFSTSVENNIRVWKVEFYLRDKQITTKSSENYSNNTLENVNTTQYLELRTKSANFNEAEPGRHYYKNLTNVTSFYFASFLQRYKKKAMPFDTDVEIMFNPCRVNLNHIYAHIGRGELLSKSLALGCHITIDKFGNSPLYYALERNSQKCVEIILKFMIKLSKTNLEFNKYFEYSYALRCDIYKILKLSYEIIPDYIESIFIMLKYIAR